MADKQNEEDRRRANKVDIGSGSPRLSPAERKRIQQRREAEELQEKLDEQERQQGIDWQKAKLEGDPRGFHQWRAAQRNQQDQPPAPMPQEYKQGQVSERRKKNISMRIKVGLIRWASERVSTGPETMCEKNGLPSINTYYTYKRENLVYTDEEIAALGTTWKDLHGLFTRGKLDEHIKELLLPKTQE